MWVLAQRVNIAAFALVWAIAFYTIFGYLFLERIDYVFLVRDTIAARGHGTMDDRIFPWKELLLVGCYLPVSFAIHGFCVGMRLRNRVKHDCCTECGRHITDWHGRCPGCGVRVGPDPPNRVHVLRG